MVERFTKRILATGIFDTYVAAAFFASLIFFVINANAYTPLEIMAGVVLSTIVFKGISNIMFGLSVALLALDNEKDKIEFEKSANRLESLVNDLAIQEAAVQASKNIEKTNETQNK